MGVIVVGAGPAGLRVAERLALEGVPVSVLEQRKKLPAKICSGLLSAGTVKRYSLEDIALNAVNGARIHARGSTVFIERKNVAYVFDRFALDSLLLDRAESSGANARFGTQFERSCWDGSGVLVGADGFASTVRSSLGIRPPRYVMGAIGTVNGNFDNYVDIYLVSHLTPGFFAWLIPKSDNVAEVGLGVDAEHSSEVLSRLRALSKRLGFPSIRVLGVRPIPIDFPAGRVVYGNVALVGDAAVQTKATTGGGISYGLTAADALADTILSNSLHEYQRFHRFRLVPRLLIHLLVRKYLNSVNPERLIRLVQNQNLENTLSKRGDMDDPTFALSSDFLPFILRSAFLLI